MDLCTLVKAGCIGSACLLMQGVDPMVRADPAPAAPGVELHGLPDYRPSQLGLPGLFRGRPIVGRDRNAIVRDRISQLIVRRLHDQAMKELTGKNSAQDAGRSLSSRKTLSG